MLDDTTLQNWLYRQWGVATRDLSSYRIALHLQTYHNLEFLGDSILGFVVANYLFDAFPHKDEGWFTRKRMVLVNSKFLAQLGEKMGIADIAEIPETSSRDQLVPRVQGDMIEALIGAIYKDQGLSICTESISRVFAFDKIDEELEIVVEDNISKLQEYLNRRGEKVPKYKVLRKFGEDHDPTFVIKVSCSIKNRVITAIGEGKCKKAARNEAAQNAWLLVSRHENP